jgi:hypothetical protein
MYKFWSFSTISALCRKYTWRLRPLPSFIIIGAQKAGTTSLHAYLSQHPELMAPKKKEIHYFDGISKQSTKTVLPVSDNYQKGESWYRSMFPIQFPFTKKIKTFESSPFYLFHPLVAGRIKQKLPECKLIVLLRNPTERAISHYFAEVRKLREHASMRIAMQQEETILAPIIEACDYLNVDFRNYSYKSRGLYKQQLDRYFECFDQEQMLILQSEKLFSDPNNTMNQVLDFLGLKRFSPFDFQARNVGSNKLDIDPTIYQELNNYFKPYNEELFESLNRRFDWD